MILLSLLNISVLFALLKKERSLCPKKYLSPASLYLYFAFLPALSNLYFSINAFSFEKNVLGLVDPIYRDYTYVYFALMLEIVINLLMFISIHIGIGSKAVVIKWILKKLTTYPLLIVCRIDQQQIPHSANLKRFGLFSFVLALALYVCYLNQIGGLVNLWLNMMMRAELGAGLGYLHLGFMFLFNLSGGILFYFGLIQKSLFYTKVMPLLIFAILASLGSRGPGIIFLFSLLIIREYKCENLKRLISAKVLLYAALGVLFVLGSLQFRTANDGDVGLFDKLSFASIVSSIDSGFIARVGRLERDIVILKYFSENDYWYGASYLGVLTAPIPRGMFPEKPPVDSGMYLRSLAIGNSVTPPAPVNTLDGSSWPENHFAGYMNFGLIGLFLTVFAAGLLYGKIFSAIRSLHYPIVGVVFFAFALSQGPIPLSPKGVVLILSYVLMLLMTRVIYEFAKVIMKKNKNHLFIQ